MHVGISMKDSVKTKIENMKLYELPRKICNTAFSSVHPQGLFTARCQQHTKLWHLKPTGGSLKPTGNHLRRLVTLKSMEEDCCIKYPLVI
jgi:hypothetical protein